MDKLLEKGFDVRVFDKVEPLQKNVDWFRGDLLNDGDVSDACEDIEVIFHLGAIADVNVALSNPEGCLMVNENGLIKLLNVTVKKKVEHVILASTIWVYGNAKGTVDEDCPIPMPDHIYTKTKIGQEHLLYCWHKLYGLPYTILRYGIPYGPRMRPNLAIATFVQKAMRREPIAIFGDGEQGRCFIYVEDLAEGNVAALKNEGKNEAFNLAGREFVTINQIVKSLEEIFGRIKTEYKPARPGDFRGTLVSIEKAKRILNWDPRTNFLDGLRKYIESSGGV